MSDTNSKVAPWLGVFVLSIAFSALIGWTFDIPFLISISPNLTAMNPVTAVTFVLVAISMLLLLISESKSIRFIGPGIAFLVFLTGLLKLLDYAGAISIHMDRLLFPAKLSLRMLHNAIAPTTAVLFLLLGIVLFDPRQAGKYKRIANDCILFGAFLIAYMGIIGYVYGLETFYRIGPFVPMALNTALCFTASVTGLFLSYRKGNLYRIFFSKHVGGKLVRRAVPLVLLIPPAFGYSKIIFQKAQFYNVAYGVALDTAVIVLVVLLMVFYYATMLNKNDLERKAAEQEIVSNEEKYRSLLYSLQEGVVYFDTASKILFYNPSFSALTGYGPNELTGENIRDIIIPEDDQDRQNEPAANPLPGIPREYETQLLRKDGSRIIVQTKLTPLFKDGAPVSFLSTLTDITERKKREEDIEAFSASAAHDLNAPLARIQMLIDHIIDDSSVRLNSEDLENLGIILKTTVDMRVLLHDLLLFAKIGAEKISREQIDMNKMAQEIINSAGPSKAEIELGDLPAANGEASAVKQVWANLINNAIKYSSKKEKPVVQIGSYMQNNKNIYYVKDNGAGFNMSEAPKLFAPFKRMHSDFEGNGLGLPIVKRIIEKHNGQIWAASERDKGTTFYFFI